MWHFWFWFWLPVPFCKSSTEQGRPLGVPVDPTIIRRWFPVVRRPDGDLDLGTAWRLTTAPRRRSGQMQRNKFHFLNSHLLSIYLYIYIKKNNLILHPPMFLLIFQVQPSHFTQIINVTQSQIRVSTLVEGSQGRGKKSAACLTAIDLSALKTIGVWPACPAQRPQKTPDVLPFCYASPLFCTDKRNGEGRAGGCSLIFASLQAGAPT